MHQALTSGRGVFIRWKPMQGNPPLHAHTNTKTLHTYVWKLLIYSFICRMNVYYIVNIYEFRNKFCDVHELHPIIYLPYVHIFGFGLKIRTLAKKNLHSWSKKRVFFANKYVYIYTYICIYEKKVDSCHCVGCTGYCT
jgi:hypothetical protein